MMMMKNKNNNNKKKDKNKKSKKTMKQMSAMGLSISSLIKINSQKKLLRKC